MSWKNISRLFAPAFWVVLILLVGAEIVSRIFFADTVSGRFEYGYHPTAGFVEKSDGAVKLVRAGGRRFRPQQFTKKRDPNVFRIFVIGDSVPRGPELEDSYAVLLEGLLKERGIRAEGFNMGVAGYGARRAQLVLKKTLEYDPSLIVLHINNSNEFEDEREFLRAQRAKSWHPSEWMKKIFIFARLYEAKTEKAFWKWLPGEIREQEQVNDADAEIAAGENEETRQQWMARLEQTVREDVQLCLDRRVPLVIVTQARRDKARVSLVLEDNGLDAFAATLEGPAVRIVSMKETFAGTDLPREYADTAHLRRAGHERIAKAILAELEISGLLKRP